MPRRHTGDRSRPAGAWISLALLVIVLPAVLAVVALGGSAVLGRLRPGTASAMITD